MGLADHRGWRIIAAGRSIELTVHWDELANGMNWPTG
jgi:hypothetical protein